MKGTHAKELEGERGEIVVTKKTEVKWTDAPPAHHANKAATRFQNPWPSWRWPDTWQFISMFGSAIANRPKVPADLAAQIPTVTPDWSAAGSALDAVKATWLGHACFLVEMPAPEGASRGPRILFDPVMSVRCSPSQLVGPSRLLPSPCAVEDLPEVDVVAISHNHYDHMDDATLRAVWKKSRPHFFAPLGNTPHLESFGIPTSHIHTLDWWEDSTVSVSLPTATSGNDSPVKASFTMACTPAQHVANRSLFDRWHTLWASWTVIEDLPATVARAEGRVPKTVFFGGDTGYRTVREGEDERAAPVCPAFKEIGEKFGGVDLALLPIGAYGPRTMFSCMHAYPGDSVAIFKDIRAKRAVGMHWGTWILTNEPIMDPPRVLKEECEKAGLEEGAFTVSALGETIVV